LLNQEPYGDRIHAAISELHQSQMVHGDIRATNVMVKDGGLEFMLVDYDWAGSHGEVRYPRHINKAPELGRPEDVEDCHLILPRHDELMLEKMFMWADLEYVDGRPLPPPSDLSSS
jgi:hypothetical protein